MEATAVAKNAAWQTVKRRRPHEGGPGGRVHDPNSAAKPPRPMAAGEHPMRAAEKPPTKTLPPEDTQDGLPSASLLSSFIALIVIRMRRRCAVRKRRAQAVPLSRNTLADARKSMLGRYSVALLLLASPGAHASDVPGVGDVLQSDWVTCCTHSSIRGGDMVHGGLNGGQTPSGFQATSQASCASTTNCKFVSYWGDDATFFSKRYYTRHASANVGVIRVEDLSGSVTIDGSKAVIFSRCRPELQPMHARRRAAH